MNRMISYLLVTGIRFLYNFYWYAFINLSNILIDTKCFFLLRRDIIIFQLYDCRWRSKCTCIFFFNFGLIMELSLFLFKLFHTSAHAVNAAAYQPAKTIEQQP